MLSDPQCRHPEISGVPNRGFSYPVWEVEPSTEMGNADAETAASRRHQIRAGVPVPLHQSPAFSIPRGQSGILPCLRAKAVGQGKSGSLHFLSIWLYHIFFKFAEEITQITLLKYVYNSHFSWPVLCRPGGQSQRARALKSAPAGCWNTRRSNSGTTAIRWSKMSA